ncbi:MAG: hypothetical protein WBG41_16605 [Acidimicrobiales bacterium]
MWALAVAHCVVLAPRTVWGTDFEVHAAPILPFEGTGEAARTGPTSTCGQPR